MDLRKDFLTGQWVSMSKARGLRPTSFKRAQILVSGEDKLCPFCEHNQHIATGVMLRHKNTRVIPNKYPAVAEDEETAFGVHDVIIDSFSHDFSVLTCKNEELADVLYTIYLRATQLSKNERLKSIQIFKNHGADAGASLIHSHWQIIALPIIPAVKETMASNFSKYKQEQGTCYLCDLRDTLGDLIAFENEDFLAFCPYASLNYYGVNILPKKHIQCFTSDFFANKNTLLNFSDVLKRVLKALAHIFTDLSYNICFNCMPRDSARSEKFDNWHFFVQIIPRLSPFAGFELSTGCFINSKYPNDAAHEIRGAINESLELE